MKNFYLISFIAILIMACSSDDDANSPQNPTQMGEYSLILNGDGFTEQRVELFNDTINFVGAGALFAASDDFNNGLSVVVPSSGEMSNVILEFPDNPSHPSGYEPDTASFAVGNTIYRSEDGVFDVEEFDYNSSTNCARWIGNLNINFTRDGLGGDVLNVQGTFEVRSDDCDN